MISNGSFDNIGNVFVDNTGRGSDDLQSAGSTNIPGWSSAPGLANDFWASPSSNYGLSASPGNSSGYFVDLTGQADNKPYGGIEQTIATTVGSSYTITFDLGASTLYNGSGLNAAALIASATGSTLDASQEFTLVPTSANQWVSESLSFVADSTSTTIEFRADSAYTSHYTGLDNVSVVLDAACYAAGTRIATADGEVPIETLQTGDLVRTASGALRPVRWLGHRRIDTTRHPDPARVWPFLVAASAFGPGMPSRDLWLSPGHNVVSQGVLIPISALRNGSTIAQVPMSNVEYWHIELDAHDIIFAEGLPAESYLDTGNRCTFINGGEFIEQHPDFRPKHWQETCLPLILEGNEIARAKSLLLDRAMALGYVLTAEDDLHIIADGHRFEPVRVGEARVAFLLSDSFREIVLRSRTFIPAQVKPESQDGRELGICVSRLQIDGQEIPLGRDEAFTSGWHHLEGCPNEAQQRWTNGATKLPVGCRLIVIDIAGQGFYWSELRRDNVVALFGIRTSAVSMEAG